MAKNCTCSQLQETIDKIFIDDSCCCQNTVVTPTDNCCSCEPIIDLIDTDKFACASFNTNRSLKYQMIKESWLVYGTDSKTVYDAIIESQTSNILLLVKVLGGGVNENNKNYVISPLEVSKDVEHELYVVKYLKFIENELHICTYTTHKVDQDNYETSWQSDLFSDFDGSLYYTKIEIDNKLDNYYNKAYIDINFYKKGNIYNKTEINNFITDLESQILWEKGEGHESSTQRKNVNCEAIGSGAFATGQNNTVNGNASAVVGNNNTINGNSNFSSGQENKIYGDYNIVGGYRNKISANGQDNSNCNFIGGENNIINQNSRLSTALGYGNTSTGVYNFIGGQQNTIEKSPSSTDEYDGYNNFVYGHANKLQGVSSSSLGSRNNIVDGASTYAFGGSNIIKGKYSSSIGCWNVVQGDTATNLGSYNNVLSSGATTIGCNNIAKRPYSVALNAYNRAEGLGSISGGLRSYTYMPGSSAIGSAVEIKYYAKLIDRALPNTNNHDYWLVLTHKDGSLADIAENSIQNDRFLFNITVKNVKWDDQAKESVTQTNNKFLGGLTIRLTDTEQGRPSYTEKFPELAIYPGIEDVDTQPSSTDDHKYNIYFKPSSLEDVKYLFNNIEQDPGAQWGQGVREISYGSGYDGCKAVQIGAHAEGQGAMAVGPGSHSEGINTIAFNRGEHACGQYNFSTEGFNDKATIFSVGTGKENYTNDNDGSNVTIIRKNALEITRDGTVYLRIKNNNNTEDVYDLGELLNTLIDKINALNAAVNGTNTTINTTSSTTDNLLTALVNKINDLNTTINGTNTTINATNGAVNQQHNTSLATNLPTDGSELSLTTSLATNLPTDSSQLSLNELKVTGRDTQETNEDSLTKSIKVL